MEEENNLIFLTAKPSIEMMERVNPYVKEPKPSEMKIVKEDPYEVVCSSISVATSSLIIKPISLKFSIIFGKKRTLHAEHVTSDYNRETEELKIFINEKQEMTSLEIKNFMKNIRDQFAKIRF